jgi:hypothetical protein
MVETYLSKGRANDLCHRPESDLPEGDLPEWVRGLSLRAVALCLDRLDNQGECGLYLGAEREAARSQRNARKWLRIPSSLP